MVGVAAGVAALVCGWDTVCCDVCARIPATATTSIPSDTVISRTVRERLCSVPVRVFVVLGVDVVRSLT
ncbi:hypothetical protein AB0M95_12860 [Sphaerisporangium sp. NPDC051017]|uniref:hypothetical protein n=1 Tax=Sphaerisporangium sp. NPDC051017 TaxID=3154636 RepID=UPI00343CB254